jgi:DNA recombination protein RmuC
MDYLFALAGFIVGAVIVWLVVRTRAMKEAGVLQQRISDLDKENGINLTKIDSLQGNNQEVSQKLQSERQKSEELGLQSARMDADFKNLREKLEVQKDEITDLQKKFTLEFENIAARLLKQNSQEFTFLNQKNIGEILNPLREKIEKFEAKVQQTYEKGHDDQTNLKAELKRLLELNMKISEEANNLTKALKSDSKKMGNWGEMILDRILEQSGLTKGQEYVTQFSDRNDAGDLIRPDVIVKLPENKHIIIDSKVSLLAYDGYVNSDDDTSKERFLKAHLDSIREHVKGLSEKKYQEASTLDSPDFILLFMPLESAFSLAIQNDPEIFNYAWAKRIVIVSPTTLLATLRTVASIWKHEKQTQNAMEIARQGSSLYDKFYNFLTDLEKIGNQIQSLQNTYEDAHNKLSTGKGNLIRQVERLKELGIKSEKSLTAKFLPDDTEPEEK